MRNIFSAYFLSIFQPLISETAHISQSKLSGTRIVTFKYKFSEMNFYSEISRVDCISKENHFSLFNIKILLSHLSHPSPDYPNFFQQEKLFKVHFLHLCIWYSKTSMARTMMARLPRLFRTRSGVRWNNLKAA